MKNEDVKQTAQKRYLKPESVKMLEKIYHNSKKDKYTNVPESYLVFTKFRDDTTNDLTKCVIAYTRCKGYFIERISSTGRMFKGKWIKGTGTRGTADLSAIINGKSVKIEIKCAATKDRQSEAQKIYQAKVQQAGAIYLIVRCFDDFYNWLNDYEDGGC